MWFTETRTSQRRSVIASNSLLFYVSSNNKNVGNTCTEDSVAAFTDSCFIILKTITRTEKCIAHNMCAAFLSTFFLNFFFAPINNELRSRCAQKLT